MTRRMEIHEFVCQECGNFIDLPRKSAKLRERGHVKDIYCPFCGKVTKHDELRQDE